jgi:tetratricopeptide (TPR) repeat protein
MTQLLSVLIIFLLATPIQAQWQVSILPYENKTDAPQQEWYKRGISESVVVALYKVPQIRLVDETPFGDTWQNAVGDATLMNKKNIHVVLQGWYQQRGNQLKIHTDIVEASNGKIRKSITSETATQHPQKAISEIVLALMENLDISLQPEQKTAVQKPISERFKNYQTTINAIRTFRQATRQAPPNPAFLSQAETGFKRAISENPQNAHATYYLGRVYELRENMSEAEATYRKTLILDFEHVMARYHLALLFKKQGRSSEALSELEQTLRQSPLNPDIQTTISELFFSQYEQTFESLTTPLKDMIQSAPDDPTGYYELGNAYDELYRYTEAADYFEQAIERDSTLADAHFKLGLIYHRKSQHEKAVVYLEQAAQHGTLFNRVYFRLGQILYLLGRHDEATAQFLKAIDKEPNYLIPRYHLGMSQKAQGHAEEAFKTFEKYASLTVDDARPYIEMGEIHQQKGNAGDAITAYQKALEISTVEVEAHHHLAHLYTDQNEQSKAIKHFKSVLRLRPDHPEAGAIQKHIQTLSK